MPRRLPKGLPIPKKRKIIVDFEDDNEPLEIEYSPRQAADEWQRVRDIGEDGDTETATILLLAKAVTRWDYEDEQGTIPITIESLETLPMEDTARIANAIKDDFEEHVVPVLERAIERQRGYGRH